jgi:cardiolipin synthase
VRSDDASLPSQAAKPPRDFPWLDGNTFALLVDGDRFFPRMLEAITAARHTILLEMYLFESGRVADRFIDALVAAVGRGVSVYLLLDSFGARGLSGRDRKRLTDNHVFLTWYNPLRIWRFRRYLSRDHRKLLLVDGRLAFTGGLGITDEFDPPEPSRLRWRETVVEIQGPVVAQWQRLFAATWNRWARLPLIDDSPAASGPAGTSRGLVRSSRGMRPITLTRSLVRRALHARRRVWIATAYFIPSRRLRRILRHRARRGLDVRLLLPGPLTDHPGVRYASHRYYARLLRDGVRIFEYQPRFMHSKLALCDDWLSIGSSNFDRWNLRRNLEANQEIDDPALAARAQALFEADFAESSEIDPAQWRHRPWYAYLREWFWRRIEVMLDKET